MLAEEAGRCPGQRWRRPGTRGPLDSSVKREAAQRVQLVYAKRQAAYGHCCRVTHLVLLHVATAAGADRPSPHTMMVATPEAALLSPYLRLSLMMGVGTVCAVQGRPGTSARLAHDSTVPWWSDVASHSTRVGGEPPKTSP